MNYGFRGIGSNPIILPILTSKTREMKILKEHSDTELLVELEPHDYERTGELDVVVAHDYVQFGRRMSLFADQSCKTPLKSEHATCSNVMPVYHDVQIPIRAFIEVILPFLNEHKYCQKEHLVFEGKPQYTYSETSITYYKDGVRMIAVPDKGTFYHMPYSLYETIKKN